MAFIIQHNVKNIRAHNRMVKVTTGKTTFQGNPRKSPSFETVKDAENWVNKQSVLFFKKYPQETFRMAIVDCDTLEQVKRIELKYNPAFSSF